MCTGAKVVCGERKHSPMDVASTSGVADSCVLLSDANFCSGGSSSSTWRPAALHLPCQCHTLPQIEKLAARIRQCTSLTSLSLPFSHIRGERLRVLHCAVHANKNLQRLLLGGNDIHAYGAELLADAFRTNTSLAELVLSHCKLGPLGAKGIAGVLRENKALVRLDLGSNAIGEEGAFSIADALRVNSSLRALRLHGNLLGDAAAKSIAEVLRNDACSLEDLCLSVNNITNVGAIALADALSDRHASTAFLLLDMRRNHIQDLGAKRLAQVADSAAPPWQLEIAGNFLSKASDNKSPAHRFLEHGRDQHHAETEEEEHSVHSDAKYEDHFQWLTGLDDDRFHHREQQSQSAEQVRQTLVKQSGRHNERAFCKQRHEPPLGGQRLCPAQTLSNKKGSPVRHRMNVVERAELQSMCASAPVLWLSSETVKNKWRRIGIGQNQCGAEKTIAGRDHEATSKGFCRSYTEAAAPRLSVKKIEFTGVRHINGRPASAPSSSVSRPKTGRTVSKGIGFHGRHNSPRKSSRPGSAPASRSGDCPRVTSSDWKRRPADSSTSSPPVRQSSLETIRTTAGTTATCQENANLAAFCSDGVAFRPSVYPPFRRPKR